VPETCAGVELVADLGPVSLTSKVNWLGLPPVWWQEPGCGLPQSREAPSEWNTQHPAQLETQPHCC
jgi:hypothetical protein